MPRMMIATDHVVALKALLVLRLAAADKTPSGVAQSKGIVGNGPQHVLKHLRLDGGRS